MKKVIIAGSEGLIGKEVSKYFKSLTYECINLDLKLGHDLTNEAFKKEVFGAPTFIVNGKIFWGQDRLEYALDELSYN